MTSSNALRNPNSYRHKDGEQGFSLVELSVALAIIAAGVVGTLSRIGSNRALMENAWLQKRLTLVANGIASEIVARHARGDAMSPVASYSWSTDAFALSPLFSDNQLRTEDASLSIATSSDPDINFLVTIRVASAGGRALTLEHPLYAALK